MHFATRRNLYFINKNWLKNHLNFAKDHHHDLDNQPQVYFDIEHLWSLKAISMV